MTFQEENNELLQSILNSYYRFWKLDKKDQESFNNGIPGNLTFEIFVTPKCNQACSYCYLVKHGEELYPSSCVDNEKILSNLKILLNYCLESSFRFPKFDIFSGEILGTELGNKVLTIILDYIERGLQIDHIVIPSNCSFLYNTKATEFIQKCIDRAASMGCRISISASVDGAIIDTKTRNFISGREVSEKLRTEEFYDRVFAFCRKNMYGVHPMVSALSVKYWIEQYDWWQDAIFRRIGTPELYQYSMFLEVRDNNWTDEAIRDYLKFLNHMIDADMKACWEGREDELLRIMLPAGNITGVSEREKELQEVRVNYIPYRFPYKVMALGCSAQTSMSVRLGDLAIYPCHRTCYDKFIYGHYVVENGKITGLKAKNVLLANRIINQSTKGMMRCNSCSIDHYCIRGCYGAQYEASKELFYPCETVCRFNKIRLLFLYEKVKSIYQKYNLSNKITIDYKQNELEDTINKVLEEEDMLKWKQEISTLI